jgi:hypothetical protein
MKMNSKLGEEIQLSKRNIVGRLLNPKSTHDGRYASKPESLS